VVTEFSSGISGYASPDGITSGPDGNLWITEPGVGGIAKLSPSGAVTEFFDGISGVPASIVTGPDGNLWFTEAVETSPGDHLVQENLLIGQMIRTGSCPPARIDSHRAVVSRRGRLKLALSCHHGSVRCAGTVTLTAHGPRRARIAKASYSLQPGETSKVVLHLNAKGRNLLRTAKHHRLEVLARSGRAHRRVILIRA
jgi:hypothetical protein